MLKRFALIAALFSALASAQTVAPILQPRQMFVDASGAPCAGCKLYTYAAGTTTPLPTFTDSTGAHQNTNPITLGTDGSAVIWMSLSSYKFSLNDANGSLLWTVDNVSSAITYPGSTVGFLNTPNTWTQAQTFSVPIVGTATGNLPLTGGTLSGPLIAPAITISGPFLAPQINAVYDAATEGFGAAITACGSNPCTIEVNQSIPLGNTTVPSNVSLVFNQGGNLSITGGTVVTINGPVQAAPVRIFIGSGTVTLSALVTRAYAQWWGAVADSNALGSTGTDNTATIQAGLNAIAQGAELFFPAGNYKITAALLINRSQVSMRGVGGPVTYTPGWPTPHPSRIVTNSPTADIIDLWGTSTSVTVTDNNIQDLTLSRGVIPSAAGAECSVTGAGISMKFSYAAVVENISIEDSATGIYMHGVGASTRGHIENIDAIWGSNGITETTGLLCGYYEDSKDGTASPSLRIRNYDAQAPQIPTSHPGLTIYGFSAKGKQMSDIHSYHFEAYNIDIGISLVGAGMTGFAQATDIFFENFILDNILLTGIQVYNTAGYGTFNFTDGWIYINGASASPAVDVNASGSVHLNGDVIFSPAITAPVISVVTGGSEQIVNTEIIGGTAGAITLDNSSASVISNNLILSYSGSNWGTNIINLINNSSYSVVANNSLNGTATNGISVDVATTATEGLETNSIGYPSLGTITNKFNVSAGNFVTPFVGTTSVGQAVCQYAAGPPVVLGHCTSVVGAGGACTCAN